VHVGTLLVAVVAVVVTALAPVLPAAAQSDKLSLQVAGAWPEGDYLSEAARYWQAKVTEGTKGRITFRTQYAGALLPGPRMLEGVRDGLADVSAHVVTSYFSGSVPDFIPFEVPFAFPMDRQNWAKMNAEVFPIVDEILREHNQKAIYSASLMPDPVTCRDKFVANEAAWKGVKIRTAGRWQSETIQNWGGSPVFMPLGDLYIALQRGTVDCTLLVYNLLQSFKITEVAKYVTRADHSINYLVLTMNLGVWNKLSPAEQQVLLAAGRDTERHQFDLMDRDMKRVIDAMKASRVKFCTPNQAELDRLVGKAQIWDKVRQAVGPRGNRIVDVLQKYRDQVRRGPADTHDNTPC
jgi:TRAP-type C4-dicarboxylate transport system substrate-binding protein